LNTFFMLHTPFCCDDNYKKAGVSAYAEIRRFSNGMRIKRFVNYW